MLISWSLGPTWDSWHTQIKVLWGEHNKGTYNKDVGSMQNKNKEYLNNLLEIAVEPLSLLEPMEWDEELATGT